VRGSGAWVRRHRRRRARPQEEAGVRRLRTARVGNEEGEWKENIKREKI